MNLVKYDEILNNCGVRTIFDSYGFEKLLKKYIFNWKNIIIKRHHQFVESYIKNKGNMSKVSKDIGYPMTDLRAIFLRIQSQFELYDEDNDIVFADMVLGINGLPIITGGLDYIEYVSKYKNQKQLSLKSVLQNTDCDNATIIELDVCKHDNTIEDNLPVNDVKEFIDISTVLKNIEEYLKNNSTDKRTNKLSKYGEEFGKLEDISIIKQYVSKKAYEALVLLTQGKSLKDISKELNSPECYLICCILGRNNPRSKTEFGIIKLIKPFI